MIAWVAICQAANPGKDPHPSDHVLEAVDPVFEFLGAFHIHAGNCSPPATIRQSALGPIPVGTRSTRTHSSPLALAKSRW